MALINCHECGHEIADTARQCPNCGSPTEYQKREWEIKKEQSEKHNNEVWLAIGVVLSLIFLAFNFFLIKYIFINLKDNYIDSESTIAYTSFVALFTIAFYVISIVVIKKISKRISQLLVLFFTIFLISFFGLNLYWYYPYYQFRNNYFNSNVLTNLDKRTITYEDFKVKIKNDSVELSGLNKKPLRYKIYDIDEDGEFKIDIPLEDIYLIYTGTQDFDKIEENKKFFNTFLESRGSELKENEFKNHTDADSYLVFRPNVEEQSIDCYYIGYLELGGYIKHKPYFGGLDYLSSGTLESAYRAADHAINSAEYVPPQYFKLRSNTLNGKIDL